MGTFKFISITAPTCFYYARHRVKSKLWRYFPPTTPLDLDVCRISRSHETWLLGPTPPPTKPHQTGSHRQSQTKVLLGILYLAPRPCLPCRLCLNERMALKPGTSVVVQCCIYVLGEARAVEMLSPASPLWRMTDTPPSPSKEHFQTSKQEFTVSNIRLRGERGE